MYAVSIACCLLVSYAVTVSRPMPTGQTDGGQTVTLHYAFR